MRVLLQLQIARLLKYMCVRPNQVAERLPFTIYTSDPREFTMRTLRLIPIRYPGDTYVIPGCYTGDTEAIVWTRILLCDNLQYNFVAQVVE